VEQSVEHRGRISEIKGAKKVTDLGDGKKKNRLGDSVKKEFRKEKNGGKAGEESGKLKEKNIRTIYRIKRKTLD